MYTVITKYVSNDSGRGGIVATTRVDGKRRQRTRPYDHAKSSARQHGEAAADLLLSVTGNKVFSTEDARNAQHEANEDGNRHVFTI